MHIKNSISKSLIRERREGNPPGRTHSQTGEQTHENDSEAERTEKAKKRKTKTTN